MARYSMLDTYTVGIVSAPKGRRRKHLTYESFPKTYRSVLATLLVVEKSSLENAPEGCDRHRRIRELNDASASRTAVQTAVSTGRYAAHTLRLQYRTPAVLRKRAIRKEGCVCRKTRISGVIIANLV